METFTPIASFSGGMLIGVAAALLILVSGRIAGISGIAGGLLSAQAVGRAWRIQFLVGLVAGALAAAAIGFESRPQTDAAWPVIVLAGLLVGFGTRLGGGCTSGHGVCGLARLSLRSLAATAVFMIAGMGTVFLLRHVPA